MGQQSSRHSNDARSTVHSRDISFDSRDITLFTSRFRDILSDPAYDNGIRSDSVVDMVTDIGHVFLGVKHYICAPEPIDGISPVTHIAFKDESLMIPDSLEIKPRKTGKGEKKRISRRSQSYNESRPSSMMPSRQSSMRQPSIRRFDPVTEAVMSDIDRTMEPLEMSDDEHDIIEEDEDRVSIGSVQREPSPEPVYEAPVEKAPTRRVNRRRVQS